MDLLFQPSVLQRISYLRVSNLRVSVKKNRTGLVVGIVVGGGLLLILLLAVLYIVQRRKRPNTSDNEDLSGIDIGPLTFSFSELKTATNDFSPVNKLGEGGLDLCKGILNDGRSNCRKAIILVWPKLYDGKKTHISTQVAGTIGYLAPEYAMRGQLTQKTDVFSFGVVALEIVSGRPNSDQSLVDEMIYLLEWAWNLHENKREVELVDSRLSEFNEEEVTRITKIGLLCTKHHQCCAATYFPCGGNAFRRCRSGDSNFKARLLDRLEI
ncbi:hypothetical protein M0R45_005812 [Rubus argutus]|uniref:Protein kinase domain-containing protein n=1 Tax=Rubus argutus TaxID=59490 RepID=A0AAW1YNV4_RUBAR